MTRARRDVVVTGMGVVSPIGIGWDAFGQGLRRQESAIGPLTQFDARDQPVTFGGEVRDFDPKLYVRPRKSLKVMSREIQLGFAAADLAFTHAGLAAGAVEPERLGVVFGADMIYCEPTELAAAFRACVVDGQFDFARWGTAAMREMFPLWMLKYLPNMSASHIGIALDARGPTNAITIGDVSSLVALAEAASVIERGWADVMLAGGSSSRVHPSVWPFRDQALLSHRNDDPASACRPFDCHRDGMVVGEGAAAVVLEDRSRATARGATIYGSLAGFANTFQSPGPNLAQPRSAQLGVQRAIEQALRSAQLQARDIGHVSAAGLSTPAHDQAEAQAIRHVLGHIPVTAPKSYFGNLGAASTAVELIATLAAFESGEIPPTLHHTTPDPACPVQVVHGAPAPLTQRTALLLSQSIHGQHGAMVVRGKQDS